MITLPNYEIVRVIGSGSFGFVFQAVDKTNNRKVAFKRIEKVGSLLSREYEILQLIKECPHVVQVLDFFYTKTEKHKLVQNIVFQFCDSDLQSWIRKQEKEKVLSPLKQVKQLCADLLAGLRHIHGLGVAHRDLKPENVLLLEGRAKICDFGSSKVLDLKGKNTPYIVSRYYRAPQLMLCVSDYSTSIDIWAAGCILAEMLLQEPIFVGKTEGEQLIAIFRTMGSFSLEQKQHYSQRVPFDKNILDKLGAFKPKPLRQVLGHTIADQGQLVLAVDLLSRMLKFVPEERITAEEALKHPFFAQ